MNGPSPRGRWKYVTHQLRVKKFLASPGDGRPQPKIPAQALWSASSAPASPITSSWMASSPPLRFRQGQDRVEIWDADDFDPWETLRWETVRVIRYRQYKPNGEAIEAYWLTNFSARRVGSRSL
jgi:hypothetical protein